MLRPLLRLTWLVLLAVPAFLLCAGDADAQVKAVKCRDCHPDIYDEWRNSQHAKAYRDPRFQAAMKAAKDPASCVPCHAPNPILDAGIGVYPTTRRRYKSEGVTCVTCHAKGDAYAGPYAGKDMDDVGHYSVQVKEFKSYKLCATCHGQEKEKVH
ncbi:MAG: multiheme c-type cytochrome, partial [Planctomycetota bacterium]